MQYDEYQEGDKEGRREKAQDLRKGGGADELTIGGLNRRRK